MVDYDNVLVVYYDRVLVLCEQHKVQSTNKTKHVKFTHGV